MAGVGSSATETINVSPFRFPTPMTNYERIKMALMCLTLIPFIRLFFLGLSSLLILVLGKISLLGLDPREEQEKPIQSPWRRFIIHRLVPFVGRWVLLPSVGVFRICETGHIASVKRAPILVANHSTLWDGFVIAVRHFPMVLSLRENLNSALPVVGAYLRMTQSVLVDRHERSTSVIAHMKERATYEPPKGEFGWRHLLIFPEGTTCNRRALLQFKKGAFSLGVPVQPVVLKWPCQHFDHCWLSEGPSTTFLLFRTLCQVYNSCEVEYLPPVVPTEDEVLHPEKFTARVRGLMATAMEVPLSVYSLEDSLIRDIAIKKHPRLTIPDSFLFSDLKRKHSNLHTRQLKHLIFAFIRADTNKDGVLSRDEFTAFVFKHRAAEASFSRDHVESFFRKLSRPVISGSQHTPQHSVSLVPLIHNVLDLCLHECDAEHNTPAGMQRRRVLNSACADVDVEIGLVFMFARDRELSDSTRSKGKQKKEQ